jgi:hypothetical protein
MRPSQARARLRYQALGATLAVVAALLLGASPLLGLTQEEINQNERFKALSQEADRLVDEVFHKKSYQLKGSYEKKAALRKLRKAEANYEEMIAIIKKQRADAQAKNLPYRVKAQLDATYRKLEKGLRTVQDAVKLIQRRVEKKR